MAFFEEIDTFQLLDANAQRIRELENSESETLKRLYRKVRARLQENLRVLASQGRSDRFTAQQNRQVLIQLEGAINAMDRTILDRLFDVTDSLSKRGVQDLFDETEKMSEYFTGSLQPINIDAALVASDPSNLLLNRFEASVNAYSAGLRAQIGQGLAEMVVEPTPLNTVVHRIGEFFAGEEWKVLRIARTELHNIYATSKLSGIKAVREKHMPGMKKTLFHPKDDRTSYDSKWLIANAKRMIKETDEPFDYWWSSKQRRGSFDGPSGGGKWYRRTFMAPPDRPNDRAILIPYHPSWG